MHALVVGLSVLSLALSAMAADPLIRQRADPQVYRHTDGYYYFTATVPKYDSIELRRSKTLNGLATAEPVTIWHQHKTGPMANHIWAPELHFIAGKWYVYFAAGTSQDQWAIRIYVLTTDAANPLEGKWTEAGQLKTGVESFSLDATTFELDGTQYLVWAQHTPPDKTNTDLYIAKMATPTKLASKPVRISKPDLPWERIGYKVNEGPALLMHDGKLFLTYSASATDANYCMGMLTADAKADLLDPKTWHKSQAPVLATNAAEKIFGPGHNSFTTASDGANVIVFHARDYRDIKGDPLNDPNRSTYLRKITWSADGTPVFDLKATIALNE